METLKILKALEPLAQQPAVPGGLWQPAATMKIQLTEHEVRVVDAPDGEAVRPFVMPYQPEEIPAVLKALQGVPIRSDRYTVLQLSALERLGLTTGSRPVPDLHERVGQHLYRALIAGEVANMFFAALQRRQPLAVQLRFDEDAAVPARLPWELIHDGRRFLIASGMVELTRYLAFPQRQPIFALRPPVQILSITARPSDLPMLPSVGEYEQIKAEIDLNPQLTADRLIHPSFAALTAQLARNPYQIVHFDGHGSFHRRCRNCGMLHYPHLEQCQNAACAQSLRDSAAQGALAFEGAYPDRAADWIDQHMLSDLLAGTATQLLVLSACESSTVRGPDMADGLAPALIRAGIPAVLSMQLPISVESARSFIQQFYRGIACGMSIGSALVWARKRLITSKDWYIPTFYVRV